MNDSSPGRRHEREFYEKVFPAELAEIARRRKNAGVDSLPESGESAAPSTSRGLVGLAFSGGGIRSASFCLGVVQRLIANGVFKQFDYLSTVSGGGYTGSCLSTLMHRDRKGERALVDRRGSQEPPALNHLRNASDYLIPAGFLNLLRLPAVIFVGALHSLLLMLPLIVLAVFVTEVFFELMGRYLPIALTWAPVLGLAPLVFVLLLRPALAALGWGERTWRARDRAGRRLAAILILAACSVLALPTLYFINYLVTSDPPAVIEAVQSAVASGLESAVVGRGWLLWGGAVVAGLLTWSVWRWGPRLLVLAVGAAGPLVIVGVYLLCCLYVINSPVVTHYEGDSFVKTLAGVYGKTEGEASDAELDKVRSAALRVLGDKRMDPKDYGVPVLGMGQSGVYQVVVERLDEPAWWWPLTTYYEPKLTIHLLDADCLPDNAEECSVVIDELSLVMGGHAEVVGGHAEWWFYLVGLLLFFLNSAFVSINRISIHGFYRDRLSRTFLIEPDAGDVRPQDTIKLSNLGGEDSAAPYHLINTSLNLQGSDDPQLRDRKTVPFLLAKLHCGSDYTGYCPTTEMEREDPRFDLGAAMAISAAAASPNMGAVKVGPLSFVMAMLNLRLNYWLPNPEHISPKPGFAASLRGKPGLVYLCQEAIGSVDDNRRLVNCSDGGHFENLAVYELIKRRCRTVVCVDGEADPDYNFGGFNTLQRYVEIDLSTRITIDLEQLIPGKNGVSERQYAVGSIAYPDGEQGMFIYLKLSRSGAEPQYVQFYRKQHGAFPHESTSDQFFDETQFEVYRALGAHIADGALKDPEVRAPLEPTSETEL